jgi:hypothetical protein
MIELVIYGLLVGSILVADTTRDAITAVAVGTIAVLLLKVHGGAAARILAQQAEAITAEVNRRWRLLMPAGLVLSAAALLAPMPFAGSADGDISWDLDFLQTKAPMVRIHNPVESESADGWSARSRWMNPDGWHLHVDASPLRPFEPIESAWRRISTEIGGASEVVRIGTFQAMWGSGDASASGDGMTQVRLAVIDQQGRDVHVLSADVDPGRRDFVRSRLEHILRTAIWVKPRALH